MSKKILMPVLCLAGVALNIAINRFFVYYLGLPLFMDTIFTVTVTLIGGPFWGALCGALSTIIGKTIWFSNWISYLFFLCSIATALITWLFIRLFPSELNLSSEQAKYEKMLLTAGIAGRSGKLAQSMNRVIVLLLLSFALCLAISILGGLISGLILLVNPSQIGERVLAGLLSDTMSGGAVPVFLAEILSRIPVNIIDRLIAAFGGYGVAVIFRRTVR
ncbi:MAG: hypothetical protein LBQ94_03475 [Treponema sp.]|jgi:hypothetical protein|nr:hypothetical protein [Treponema sp.]